MDTIVPKVTKLLFVGLAALGTIGLGIYYAKDGVNLTLQKSPIVTTVEKEFPQATLTEEKSHPAGVANAASAVHAVVPEKTINTQEDYDKLYNSPVETIWERWRELMDNSMTDQTLATSALAQKLRQGNGEAIYAEAAEMLRNTALSASQRAQVVNLLGEASTVQALDVLAQLLRETNDDTLRYAIAEAIGRGPSGLSEWELTPHPEFSPMLESLWQQLEPDPHLANALATRIAHEGAPSGIQLLLEQFDGNKTIDSLAESNDPQTLAALNAMKEIRNPQALPLLKKTFQTQPQESAAFVASGTALSWMGNVEATKTLLNWARQAPEDAAEYAQQWIGSAAGRDPDSSLYLKKALAQNNTFRSGQVKKGVQLVMSER
jgi:hypothetical protein